MKITSLAKYKNFGRLLYTLSEKKFNQPLPKWIAKLIAKLNKKDYDKLGDGRLILQSYDGSDQVVHPDFVQWNNCLWLVCTPYPYGFNKCENPSIYFGKDLQSLTSACKNPIDFPSSKSRGSILSDPCFFENDNKLLVCYRERIQKKSYVEYNLYVQSSINGTE